MIEFDGITFANENGLWEFLKHEYFAHRDYIDLLKIDLQKARSRISPSESDRTNMRQSSSGESAVDVG